MRSFSRCECPCLELLGRGLVRVGRLLLLLLLLLASACGVPPCRQASGHGNGGSGWDAYLHVRCLLGRHVRVSCRCHCRVSIQKVADFPGVGDYHKAGGFD